MTRLDEFSLILILPALDVIEKVVFDLIKLAFTELLDFEPKRLYEEIYKTDFVFGHLKILVETLVERRHGDLAFFFQLHL